MLNSKISSSVTLLMAQLTLDGVDARQVLLKTIGLAPAVTHVVPVLVHHMLFNIPGLTTEKLLKILAPLAKIGRFPTLLEQNLVE